MRIIGGSGSVQRRQSEQIGVGRPQACSTDQTSRRLLDVSCPRSALASGNAAAAAFTPFVSAVWIGRVKEPPSGYSHACPDVSLTGYRTMHIFIDESGSFTHSATSSHPISVIGALVVPDAIRATLERKYAKLRSDLPSENGEVKGRLLSERQVAAVVTLLCRHQVLFEVTAIDMALNAPNVIAAHQNEQVTRLTANLTPSHHPNLHDSMRALQTRLKHMSPQLYVQSFMTFALIGRVIQHSTFFYSQRIPTELAAFHWVIDAKDRLHITDWEDWWSHIVSSALQSMGLREPLLRLHGADYSYFQRFQTRIPPPARSSPRSGPREARRTFGTASVPIPCPPPSCPPFPPAGTPRIPPPDPPGRCRLGVADGDFDQPVLWHCANFDAPALRCELDGVVPHPVSETREGDTNIAPPPSIVDPDATVRLRFITHAASARARAATGV